MDYPCVHVRPLPPRLERCRRCSSRWDRIRASVRFRFHTAGNQRGRFSVSPGNEWRGRSVGLGEGQLKGNFQNEQWHGGKHFQTCAALGQCAENCKWCVGIWIKAFSTYSGESQRAMVAHNEHWMSFRSLLELILTTREASIDSSERVIKFFGLTAWHCHRLRRT